MEFWSRQNKKKIYYKRYRKRRVYIDNFITALKVTWLRKMITHPDCSRSSLSSIIMNRIFSMGENYAETKAKELRSKVKVSKGAKIRNRY